MPLYRYICSNPDCAAVVDIFHPMIELGQERFCGGCGAPQKRRWTPVPHRWPAQYRPGFEDSGQRMILDPDYQARMKDKLAQAKETHVKRTAQEQKEAQNGPRRE